MEITAQLVKELRDRTGIGMMECKKALTETGGDIEAAVEELRKRGLAKAAAKADRETNEGAIKIETDGNTAYIVSVSCETDFLAKSDRYQEMLADVMQTLKDGKTAEDAKALIDAQYSLEMGENLQVQHFSSFSGAAIGTYVHSTNKLASIVVAKTSVDTEKLKQVAMHVTAASPEYLTPSDIPENVIAKEKEIQLDIMKNDPKMTGKPEAVLLNIIEGKMGKYTSEISLLEQNFVINPDQKVKDFIGADTLEAFYRFSI